jgi:hypothetical protein
MMKPSILWVEIAKHLPPMDPTIVAVSSCEHPTERVQSIELAQKKLSEITASYGVVVCNEPHKELFASVKKNHPKCKLILFTDLTMEHYSAKLDNKADEYVDHFISFRGQSSFCAMELRSTIQKILQQNIWGIEKYLAQTAQIQQLPISSSQDREHINKKVEQFALEHQLGAQIAKLAYGISEELLMNAIYDAPCSDSTHHYASLPRTTVVNLKPEESSTFFYGCDDTCLALCATDPFGSLSREKLFQYARKVLQRNDGQSLIDNKAGGAGLGLYKILYSSHAIICNVSPGKRTDVIALIDIQSQIRDFSKMARSIHYFQV